VRLGAREFVACAALGSALVLGARLLVRSHDVLGARWSDGLREFTPHDDGRVRHAVWEPAEELSELGPGRGATLSPDGRWLVFAAGERGLNAELWRAEVHGAGFGPPEPLGELNSPADELAPCFGADALWFASDRPGGQGGLDLLRAPYADGVFGQPERLAPGLNSPADESDPACEPDSEGLVFASNRARRARADFDLYRAVPDGSGFFAVDALDALNSASDERDPAFARDARSLWFASDRAGSFDLFRAWGGAAGWERLEPLASLNGPDEERGPWLAAGGFELLFERHAPGAEPAFQRAHTRELLTLPSPPVTLAEWITLALLTLLGLLALLARRWHELDILWKCLLVSLLVHLVLLYGLRHVYPEHTEHGLGPREEPTIRVRLAPEEAPARPQLEARLGPSSPAVLERSTFAPTSDAQEAPERLALAEPTLDPAASPARERVERTAEAVPVELTLADRESRAAPLTDAAPSLALAAAPSAAETTASTGPTRAALESTGTPAQAPTAVALASVSASERDAATSPTRQRSTPELQAASEGPTLAEPRERFAPSGSAAPALELAAHGPADVPQPGGPTRSTPTASRDSGAPAEPSALSVAQPDRAAESAAPARAARAADLPASSSPARSALRTPGAPEPTPSAAAPAFDALAGLASGATERAQPTPATSPERGTFAAEAAPVRSAPAALQLAAAGGGAQSDAPARSVLAPAAQQEGTSGGPELRAPRVERGAPRAEARPEFDALAGLASPSEPAPSPGSSAPQPARESFTSAAQPAGTALPAPQPLATGEPRSGAESGSPARAPFDAELAARGSDAPAAELRAPSPEVLVARDARAAPTFDALSGLAPSGAARPVTEAPAPGRATLSALPDTAPVTPLPGPTRALALPAPSPSALPERAPLRSADTPYQNRFGAAKLRALEEFGGSAETEHAVAAGLAYLARIQNPDGSWGQRRDRHEKYLDVRVGKSALALLAFLGAGHVPGAGTEHAALVERTLTYLLATQDRASGHFGQSCAYGHGITTYALAECFALTQDERLRAPLERALAHITANQRRERDPRFFGGWGYYFGDGHVWNRDEWPRTSVTAWQIMALESARLGGLAVEDDVFEAARAFLASTWDEELRAFRYSHDPERLSSGWPTLPASTPASLFGLSLLGVDVAGEELAPARRFVLTRAPDGYRFTGDDDFVRRARGNPYFWYYGSLAMFRVGGREWESWNRALQTTLLPSQDEDGSWRPLDPYAEYAGDEDGERTYTTAMCVLSLEVYYRYFTPLLRVK